MSRPHSQVVYNEAEIPEGYEPVYRPSCDVLYMASRSGILQCIEISTSLIAFICYTMSNHNSLQVYIGSGVTITAFILSGLLLIMHTVHVIENSSDTIRWPLWEMILVAVFSILYMPTFALCVYYSVRWKMGVWAAGAFFSFVALVVYIVDLVFKVKAYIAVRNNNNGQPLVLPSPKAPITPVESSVHYNSQFETTDINYQHSPKRYDPPAHFDAPPPYAQVKHQRSVDTFV